MKVNKNEYLFDLERQRDAINEKIGKLGFADVRGTDETIELDNEAIFNRFAFCAHSNVVMMARTFMTQFCSVLLKEREQILVDERDSMVNPELYLDAAQEVLKWFTDREVV